MLEKTNRFWFLAFVLACLTGLVNPAYAQAALKGSMKLVCVPPDMLDLHFKMPSSNETLVAHIFMAALRTDGVKNAPHKSRGQWCSAENQCENVETTIIFKKFNLEKEASGTYTVEFSDGHRQQGTFKTVRTPQPKPFLCE